MKKFICSTAPANAINFLTGPANLFAVHQ